MPRFFFNVRDGDQVIRDHEGIDMPANKDAQAEAMHAARELLAEQMKFGSKLDMREFEIMNDRGEKIFSLPFRSVLRLD